MDATQARFGANSSKSTANEHEDWIAVAQAAVEFGRTRQAIESLIKTGKIECRYKGPRGNKHVSKEQIASCYAKNTSKAKNAPKTTELVAISSLRIQASNLQSRLGDEQEKVEKLEHENRNLMRENADLTVQLCALKNAGVLSPLVARLLNFKSKF